MGCSVGRFSGSSVAGRSSVEADIREGENPVPGRPCGGPTRGLLRVELFGIAALPGGTVHLQLHTGERPIANKYREGKMKSTLKRE
jgi:hypothetical protein